MQGHAFTDGVVIAHHQLGRLVFVLQVLASFAYACELKDSIVFSKRCWTADYGMWTDPHPASIFTPAPMMA